MDTPLPAPPAAPSGGRGGAVALVFAVAAALACWNPFAAPFGLAVGLAALGLSIRALRRRRGPRAVALAALLLAGGAAVASGAVLLLTAGAVTAELPGDPVVREGRTEAEATKLLDEAARRTAATRAKALGELEKVSGRESGPATGRGSAKGDGGLRKPAAPAPRGSPAETE